MGLVLSRKDVYVGIAKLISLTITFILSLLTIALIGFLTYQTISTDELNKLKNLYPYTYENRTIGYVFILAISYTAILTSLILIVKNLFLMLWLDEQDLYYSRIPPDTLKAIAGIIFFLAVLTFSPS